MMQVAAKRSAALLSAVAILGSLNACSTLYSGTAVPVSGASDTTNSSLSSREVPATSLAPADVTEADSVDDRAVDEAGCEVYLSGVDALLASASGALHNSSEAFHDVSDGYSFAPSELESAAEDISETTDLIEIATDLLDDCNDPALAQSPQDAVLAYGDAMDIGSSITDSYQTPQFESDIVRFDIAVDNFDIEYEGYMVTR
ncbi:hypothetical protein ACVBEQ_21760 [Nakamurella sp. GG22]